MPVSVPHLRQEKSRVIPAQSRQIRTPSRRPGSARPAMPQPGQVPVSASAAANGSKEPSVTDLNALRPARAKLRPGP